MGIWDYAVIAFYFVFVLALGFIYKRFSRNSSDYFRGGGGMIWPMVGISAFVMQFTAWSFTGGAGKAYETGMFFLILFGCNAVSQLLIIFVTAPYFRQMRVITGVEAIRNRFGSSNEQFFTWLPVPFFVIFGGIGLYAISIFMAAVFGTNVITIILAIGITVTVMSILGGSWAVSSSNVIQFLTVFTVVVVMAVMSLRHEAVGSLGNLFAQLPREHLNPSMTVRWSVLIPFAVMLAITQTVGYNSITQGAAGYIFVKNGSDGRKAAVMGLIGMLTLPMLWTIPALASILIFPDLASVYPQLQNPNEGAYAAMAMEVLPTVLRGLLVCAIFSATMSSMDAGLNRSAGIMVRNFYLPVINPDASEERQIFWGKVITGIFGILMILTGSFFSTLKSMPLFDLILIASASVGIPTAVPLFWGIFIKKTPAWSAWSSATFGFMLSLFLHFTLRPETVEWVFRPETPFTAREFGELRITLVNGVLVFGTSLWFFATRFFYRFSKPAYKEQVKQFFTTMHTPIDMRTEHIGSYDNDRRQYRVLGQSCVAYGGILSLFAFAPGTTLGFWGVAFCGGFIVAVGLLFWWISTKVKPAPWETSEQ